MFRKMVEILALAVELRGKGHHVFFDYSPHVEIGELTISVHKNGWADGKEPDRRFMVSYSGVVHHLEHSADEVIKYLEGLL